jgi:hypothetical protein
MARNNMPHEVSPYLSRYEVVINVVLTVFNLLLAGGLAVLTLCALFVAVWSAREASNAITESQESRFADNLPAFEIKNVPETDGQPLLGLRIKNVGKGPGMLLALGFTDKPKHSYSVWKPFLLKECVPPNCKLNIIGENFDHIAQQYAEAAKLPPSTFEQLTVSPNVFGGEQQYYIQFSDVFQNQYRQYFYYHGKDMKVVSYGQFEVGPRGNDDFAIWPPPRTSSK